MGLEDDFASLICIVSIAIIIEITGRHQRKVRINKTSQMHSRAQTQILSLSLSYNTEKIITNISVYIFQTLGNYMEHAVSPALR